MYAVARDLVGTIILPIVGGLPRLGVGLAVGKGVEGAPRRTDHALVELVVVRLAVVAVLLRSLVVGVEVKVERRHQDLVGLGVLEREARVGGRTRPRK